MYEFHVVSVLQYLNFILEHLYPEEVALIKHSGIRLFLTHLQTCTRFHSSDVFMHLLYELRTST